ncbi:MAG: PorP/SprF family type IX secretion system membrane protein [Pseudarcicella sp.]|nr:PorP/SprF family type IX secretion system membrane protein [Pseudarcicella sp.]MBP6409565.1 PorP/SprF family type IX secretion system membrane protein [Pseudarcicella sp.]
MLKKLSLILLAGMLNIAKVQAQQNMPQLSQYMLNSSYINPATTGIGNQTELGLVYRSQYTNYPNSNNGIGGAFSTQVLTASVPLQFINSGVGLLILNDKTSSNTVQQQFQLSYAYHFKIGESVLSLGGRGGFHLMKLDGNQYVPPTSLDDPKIPKGKVFSDSRLDFNLGIHFKAEKFYVGASLFHVNEPKFGATFNYNYRLPQNLFISGGYNYYLNDRIELKPSLLVITDFVNPVAVNTSLLVDLDGKYWFGAGFRYGDAGIVLAGLNLMQDKLKVSYSLDLTINGNEAKAGISNELMLSYTLPTLKIGSKKTIIKTPRFNF